MPVRPHLPRRRFVLTIINKKEKTLKTVRIRAYTAEEAIHKVSVKVPDCIVEVLRVID